MDRFGYIDAMRGWAILGVIAVHASQFSGLDGLAGKVAAQGARGVQLFYIASALTLMLSWHARRDGVLPFYVRRLFRIAPMFWLAIPFFLAVSGTDKSYWAPDGIHGWQIAATAAFVHGFHPQSINSVVGGGWSIAVEMTFYAVFPLLARTITSGRMALATLAGSVVIAAVLKPFPAWWWPDEDRVLVANYAFLWFPNQLPYFMAGIALYFLTQSKLWAKAPSARILTARPIRLLGKISYSAYLWHAAILAALTALHLNTPHGLAAFILEFPCLIAATAVLSTTTYFLVETPMITLGSHIAKGALTWDGFAIMRRSSVR